MDTWKDTLTRHQDDLGLVVWVSIRSGLGQVVNCHLILLARIYHKVAEGKPPLRTQEEEVEWVTQHPQPLVSKVPISYFPTISQKKKKKKDKRISKIRGMRPLSFLHV